MFQADAFSLVGRFHGGRVRLGVFITIIVVVIAAAVVVDLALIGVREVWCCCCGLV